MKLILTRLTGRLKGDKSSLGFLKVECDDDFFLYTLELPWKENKKRVSCVPCGDYILKFRKPTGRFNYDHIILEDVRGRTYILFHYINYPKDTKGCIGTGLSQSKDFIGDTVKAHKKLMKRILPELKDGKCKLKIRDHV